MRLIGLAVVLALSLALAPLAAEAQPAAKVPRIGLFHVGLDHDPPGLAPLRESLRRMGYEEGRNIRLDYRNQADEDAARATARAFVRERVDVLVAFENQAVRATQAATSEIPVVFAHVSDPVAAGFVKSIARPGGNLTGVAVEEGAQALRSRCRATAAPTCRPWRRDPIPNDAALGDATLTAGLRSPANLPAVPTLKHPEQEEEAEGGVPFTVLEAAPLDVRARACNNRLGVRGGRQTGVRRADRGAHRSHARGYEQYAHDDGEDHSDPEESHLRASR